MPSRGSLFQEAYSCKIKRFDVAYLPVDHIFDIEQMLIVNTIDMNDGQYRCLSKYVLAPNIMMTLTNRRIVSLDRQNLPSTDPL